MVGLFCLDYLFQLSPSDTSSDQDAGLILTMYSYQKYTCNK